jgi:hypothetical protein
MKVKELIELLGRFDPESQVHLGVSLPGRVVSMYENVWLGDYGGGPQLNAAPDYQFLVYVGCGFEQMLSPLPKRVPASTPKPSVPLGKPPTARPALDLGCYDDEQTAARVRDFYIFHHKLKEPLHFPDFDYEHWIPPRTTAGKYNEHIAQILRNKLLRE